MTTVGEDEENAAMIEMETSYKYLAIKNWEKYQIRMRNPNARRPYLKDWYDKDGDTDYSKLTCFQRYILDGCQRLRARFERNLPNDPTYIARALCVMSTERPCVPHAIRTLIARGFLILSNQQTEKGGEVIRGELIRGEGGRGNGLLQESETKAKPSENRKPPTKVEDPTPKSTPLDLTSHQLARGMMDALGVPGGISDLDIFAKAISLKAHLSGITLAAAYEFILTKALDAKERGEFTKPTFWMRDASYDHKPPRSKSNVATDDYQNRLDRELHILRRSNGTST